MSKSVRIALAQINPVMGNLAENVAKMSSFYNEALEAGVDVLVFGELAVCGYPPEDLMHKIYFLDENHRAIELLAEKCPKITIIAGFAESYNEKCYNSAAVMKNGKVERIYRKTLLPNYGVFDEKRYFHSGGEPVVIDINGMGIAITICEDIWDAKWLKAFLKDGHDYDLVLNLSGSPFHSGKVRERYAILERCAKKLDCAVGYCNLVGGQDELVFDGQSMFVDSTGQIRALGPAFEERLVIADVFSKSEITQVSGCVEKMPELIDEIYRALVTGTRDYVRKNGFKKVVIGLSGGIDSSLAAAIAVDALGAENVVGITMPSRFNKAETISDAQIQAENLGMEFHYIPIEPILKSFDEMLCKMPGWNNSGMGYENLQPRVRGTILMTLSNQNGYMVMTTSNKSETAVGYATLYGDTAGGFSMLKDVPKTMVYKLCSYINRIKGREVIPASVIHRPPTAELKDNQLDSDTLPSYDLLDKIIESYVEKDKSAQQLVDSGMPVDEVNRVVAMIDRNEYKRRQSPPGIKITPKAFGRDRRLPITNQYRSQAKSKN